MGRYVYVFRYCTVGVTLQPRVVELAQVVDKDIPRGKILIMPDATNITL